MAHESARVRIYIYSDSTYIEDYTTVITTNQSAWVPADVWARFEEAEKKLDEVRAEVARCFR